MALLALVAYALAPLRACGIVLPHNGLSLFIWYVVAIDSHLHVACNESAWACATDILCQGFSFVNTYDYTQVLPLCHTH